MDGGTLVSSSANTAHAAFALLLITRAVFFMLIVLDTYLDFYFEPLSSPCGSFMHSSVFLLFSLISRLIDIVECNVSRRRIHINVLRFILRRVN